MSEEKSGLGKLAGVLINLYLLTVSIAIPYYNWQFASQHGFVQWLFLGEVVPTVKGLVWPYFALHTRQRERQAVEPLSERQIDEMNLMSAERAINAAQQGNYIINSRKSDATLTTDQLEKAIDYYLQSLRSADTTDEQILNTLYPEFGTRFKRDFCAAQRLFVSGVKNRSQDDLKRSGDLDHKWQDWFMANRKQIDDSFSKALQ